MKLDKTTLTRLLTVPKKQVILSKQDMARIELFTAAGLAGPIPDVVTRGILVDLAVRGDDVGDVPCNRMNALVSKIGDCLVTVEVSVDWWSPIKDDAPNGTTRCEECGGVAIYLVQPVGSDETLNCCASCTNHWVGAAIVGPIPSDSPASKTHYHNNVEKSHD